MELTGCMRTLNLSIAGKLANVHEARAAGFSVDLFCALEACSNEELSAARSGLVDGFVAQLTGVVEHVNCSWWSHSAGVLDASGHLKHEYLAAHPQYPYRHHPKQMVVDNTLAQAHKLKIVAAMRRDSGRQYDLVWRQRPDYVSTGIGLAAVRRALLVNASDRPSSSAETVLTREVSSMKARPQRTPLFAVPQLCFGDAHTDIEAILTPAAADHYGALFDSASALYRASAGSFGGPEVLLTQHMAPFAYLVRPRWAVFRCSLSCFDSTHPCRQLLTRPMNSSRQTCDSET